MINNVEIDSSNSIRVLFIDKSDNLAGAEICLKELITHLPESSIKTFICCNQPQPHHYIFNSTKAILLYRSKTTKWWMTEKWQRRIKGFGIIERIGFAMRLGRILQHYKPHIVHINLYRPKDYLDLCVAKSFGAATVLHVRSLETQVPLKKRTFDRCDIAICISDIVKKEVDRLNAICKVQHIYDGIDFCQYQFGSSQAESRRILQLPSQTKIISSIAVLSPRKGHDAAIKAFAQVKENIPDALLLIVGGEPVGSNNSETKRLIRIADECRISDSVRFLGHCDNMKSVFAASDVIYALSRDGEAFGRVPAEAAIARRPVIATGIGATPEIIMHKQTGFLIPPGDINKAAVHTIELLTKPDLYSSIVTEAENRVRLMFDWKNNIKEFVKIYQELMVSSQKGKNYEFKQ